MDEAQDIAEEEVKAALREKFEDLTVHTEAVEVNLTECKKHLEEAEALLKESEEQQREWKQAAITLSQVLVEANQRQPDIAHAYGDISPFSTHPPMWVRSIGDSLAGGGYPDHDFEGPRGPKAHLGTVNRNLSHHLGRPFMWAIVKFLVG